LQREDVDADSADTAFGQTALIVASELGYIGMFKMLLERKGLNIDRGYNTGESGLITTARNSNNEIVEL
jgi:ankyrin repeat protein